MLNAPSAHGLLRVYWSTYCLVTSASWLCSMPVLKEKMYWPRMQWYFESKCLWGWLGKMDFSQSCTFCCFGGYFLLDLGCSSWQMLLLGRNLLIHLLLLFVCLFVLCECNNMSCSHRVSTRGEKSLQNPWIHSLKNAVHRRSVVYDPTGSFSWST